MVTMKVMRHPSASDPSTFTWVHADYKHSALQGTLANSGLTLTQVDNTHVLQEQLPTI